MSPPAGAASPTTDPFASPGQGGKGGRRPPDADGPQGGSGLCAALISPPARRPFTLLEVLVATALLAGLFLTLSLAASAIMGAWDRAHREASRLDDLLRLDRTLENLITGAVPFTWPDDKLRELPVFQGDARELTLAYRHALNNPADGVLRFCRLRLEDGELAAYYCDRPPFPESLRDERLKRSVLARGLSRLAFSYADLADENLAFIDAWPEDASYLPLGIRIQLQWRDGGQAQWLYRVAGSSRYERWGFWRRDQTATPGGSTPR